MGGPNGSLIIAFNVVILVPSSVVGSVPHDSDICAYVR